MHADLNSIKKYHQSGVTTPYAFRRQQLLALKHAVIAYENAIYDALYTDLKKSREECWVTENGFLLTEIDHALNRLSDWMRPEKVSTNLLNFPSGSYIHKEPAGVVLIIGPWNYPFQLLLAPLVGAIAAGNCAVIKPSEFAPATAAVIRQLTASVFPEAYVCCVEGDGATLIGDMMQRFVFDHVFYTGSTQVGRKIYQMAAASLVPVTLELGGKSPCVVASDANIEVAAKRIAMTKFSNAGQMCVAPDYILVHAASKDKLVAALKEKIRAFFGDDPETTAHYGRIINEKQFDRLVQYLNQGTIVYGGRHRRESLFIEPTLIEYMPADSGLMQEEIFGPLLPILPFDTREQALAIINRHPDPLAFYIFTASRATEKEWLDAVPSGGACVNNASWHLTNPNLPFGGRGASGMGAYHGKFSFETFSRKRAVMKTPAWFDPSVKYPPFKGKLRLFKWVMKW
ncbi:aldehyde dehydrogenase [Sediminibacterium soli]|uniref:aldehyde dehydrogenase n=1 Tax=Sediminibacterium soli TaxID=2698829 RepID=UPI00137ABF80|nr:aldehyde dehydrogenase [Sediminibacterium soli]NCI47772.1 aldehyde dehydrogenase [Sediminibacterium soli]